MYKLLDLGLLASCMRAVAAVPAPSQTAVYPTNTTTPLGSEPTFTADSRRRTHYCNQNQMVKAIEAQAWADAGAIAEVANEYDWGNQWQPTMNYWMGVDSTKQENFYKIRAALQNERNIHHPNWLFPEAVVDIYCGDTHPRYHGACAKYVDTNVYTFIQRGAFWNTYVVVLCPRFFYRLTSLESLLYDMSTGKRRASNASEYTTSWGRLMYHALMHLDPVISANVVADPAYGACLTAKLANQNGCSHEPVNWAPPNWDWERGSPHSLNNGDSWAFFAAGAYFQKAARLTKPGEAPDDCGIYMNQNLANFTDDEATAIILPTVDAPPNIINLQVPPEPAPENTPPDDPPTPALPYILSSLPANLATPYDAEAYFATFVPPEASSTVPPPASTTAPSAPPPAYATGMCAFHLIETMDCGNPANNLFAVIKLLDANKNDIGDTPVDSEHTLGAPINAEDPYTFTSEYLPYPIVIVGEHENDYVQFTYGALSWTSKTPNGGAYCNNGGWDPRDGPVCGVGYQSAYNNMDCFFPC